jgi:hypothetical protein
MIRGSADRGNRTHDVSSTPLAGCWAAFLSGIFPGRVDERAARVVAASRSLSSSPGGMCLVAQASVASKFAFAPTMGYTGGLGCFAVVLLRVAYVGYGRRGDVSAKEGASS